jgi:hypothetical protein
MNDNDNNISTETVFEVQVRTPSMRVWEAHDRPFPTLEMAWAHAENILLRDTKVRIVKVIREVVA